MRGTRKWALASLVAGWALVASAPTGAAAQVVGTGERVVAGQSCPNGILEGSLGISGLDCVGECSLTIRGDGTERAWSFSTEPKILAVEIGSPADGILRPGDFLVGIDRFLITTKEGGQRYATLEPGETVRVRFRRNGRVAEASIGVVGQCRDVPAAPALTSRVPPPPPKPDEPRGVGIAVAPKVRLTTEAVVVPEVAGVASVEAARGLERAAAALAVGVGRGASQTGRLGVQFSCSECGTREDERTRESVWFFSGPLEVTGVTEGGPAEKAGIQIGDLIEAIDGHPMDTDEGGLAFTTLRAGQRAVLTVVKRNGSRVDVDLVPEARVIVGVAAPEPAAVAGAVPPVAPLQPDRPDAPEPTVPLTGPEGMTLRYSGSIQGVEIEVRGNPVSVTEWQGTRTVYINADGLWIRITVPPSRGTGGG